ncbi:MAG TPA: magnesium/cobalt transporter CorA [Saprospiraceae bacterium]|nr:magnesium/cobalt transporter CorA [Saprospiraceae bacterium]
MSKKRKNIGLSPGSLIYHGEVKVNPPSFINIEYNSIEYHERTDWTTLLTKRKEGTLLWLDFKGLHDIPLIEKIGEAFSIHRLLLEDILDTSMRSKIDLDNNGILAICKKLKFDPINKNILQEQISIYLGKDFLLSFQEDEDDTFAQIRQRMQAQGSRIRQNRCDYLFYALLDYIVDQYFLLCDQMEEQIKDIEEEIYFKPSDAAQHKLYILRSQILQIRRQVIPLREEISLIRKADHPLLEKANQIFFRDLEDHIFNITDILDNTREIISGLREMYMNKVNLELNQDMKWMASVSTLAIPILFLTGVYGMNFDFMPELKWKYGYALWWLCIITILCTMIYYFKRKRML